MTNLDNRLQINYIHVEPSEEIEKFLQKKLNKRNQLLNQIREIKCNLSLVNNRSGKIYKATMEVYMDRMGFVVKEKGKEIFGVLNQVAELFHSRLNKLTDKLYGDEFRMDWGGNTTEWVNELVKDAGVGDYQAYDWTNAEPEKAAAYNIIEKFQYPNNSPIHVEEAIQIMEKYRRPFLMFRNIRTGKYSVVYKVDGKSSRKRRGYGIVEPRSAS